MGSPPATIEQLARETVQIDHPETALRALTALRRELDATEAEIVRRALQAGASWSQIARALGISKQAAHRKYRHLFEQADADQGIQVSEAARRCIQFAREEAKRLGQPAVATEHILLGILRCEGSDALAALNAEGVTLEAARDCLQTTMPGLPPKELDRPAEEFAVSAHARRIVERSRREARERGEDSLGVEHLLLALLSDSRNGAVQTLEELKTTSERIRRRLDRPRLAGDAAGAGDAGPAPDFAAAEAQLTSRSRPVSTS
ncbi:MAG TPA: Clp protease N-terminal domain-containing protein [Solirubrobacteraceae bacterium]|nr:Clp protease N-terminal domain-containing protein [Solirubrobacteraceae bacterium]